MAPRLLATGLSGTIGRRLVGRASLLPVRLDSMHEFSSNLLSDASAVIHLAAVVGEQTVRSNLDYAYQVNVLGTVELARQVAKTRSHRFILVSTSHVYETNSDFTRLEEKSALLPRGHYALQKLLAEELVQEVFRDDPTRLVIARIFSVLDHGQPPGTLGHSIMSLRHDGAKELSFVDDQRDFLSPQTIADVLITVANTNSLSGIVNICSGEPTTIREAAKTLLGTSIFERVAARLIAGQSSTPRIVGNPQLLEKHLGISGTTLFAKSHADWQMGIS